MNQPVLEAPSQIQCVILYLPRPPSPWMPADWYGSSIAGVPFLSRNILTLQRCGIRDVIVLMDVPEGEEESFRRSIMKDSRVGPGVQWISKPGQLPGALQDREETVLLLTGTALHNKKDISALLNGPWPKRAEGQTVVPMEAHDLEPLLKNFPRAVAPAHPSDSNRQEERGPGKSSSPAPALVYVRSPPITEIQTPEDFSIQQKRLLMSSGLNHDSPVTRILSRPFSRGLTRLFLNTPFSPNQITLLSFAMGLVAAGCFFQGTYGMNVLGGILLVFSTWVDGVDGEIARLKFMETEMGGKLDIVCDNIVHFLVFGAIGLGVSHAAEDRMFMYLGGIAALGSLTSFLLLGPSLLKTKSPVPRGGSPLPEPDKIQFEKFANRDFIHLILLMALANLMGVFIAIAAVGSNAFAAFVVYARFLRHKKPKSTCSPGKKPVQSFQSL